MKSWSERFRRGDPESVDGSSSPKRNSISHEPDSQKPVWVAHTPSLDNISNDNSTVRTSSTPPYAEKEGDENDESIKERLRSLLPQSWGSLLQRWKKGNDSLDSEPSSTGIQILPDGTRVSPPVSPLRERRYWDAPDGSVGDSSRSSNKPLLRDSPADNGLLHQYLLEDSVLSSIHPAEYYAEKVEVYKLKYSYLKSWPGLLRLLAGLELLFGGMVIACVIAYVQKDNEWSNSYGLYNGAYNNGLGVSGYSYRGPMTPFILAVAGLSWIITLILLVMGLTMYYRTILLDSSWWPLTEALINVVLFLLYMSMGIVYLNDLNRGGLCYTTIGVNPIMANLCRVDGGQMAGTAFIFINMLMYLIGFLVCLKMWRYETARRDREYLANMQEERHSSVPLAQQTKTKRIVFEDEMEGSLRQQSKQQNALISAERERTHTHISEVREDPVILNRAIPMGYALKPRIIADYVMKYPEVYTVEEREMYKAVFNDQYQEYKDLHRDISLTLSKFRQLDSMMAKLLREGNSRNEKRRITRIMKNYEQKKSDPAFLEKKERCDYLKAKLSHIKNRIRDFDQGTMAKKGGRT